MKQINPLYYVSFGGNLWSAEEGNHVHERKVAKKLLGSEFAQYVRTTQIEHDSENKVASNTYYECDGAMITHAELQLLKTLGVRNLNVKSLHVPEIPNFGPVTKYTLLILFIVWNLVLMGKLTNLF